MSNRTRPYAYTFRVTENERKIIIKAITNKPIVVFANSGEILNELKRQGNNLNQIVRANYYGLATKRELLSCVEELKNTYREIAKAIEGT